MSSDVSLGVPIADLQSRYFAVSSGQEREGHSQDAWNITTGATLLLLEPIVAQLESGPLLLPAQYNAGTVAAVLNVSSTGMALHANFTATTNLREDIIVGRNVAAGVSEMYWFFELAQPSVVRIELVQSLSFIPGMASFNWMQSSSAIYEVDSSGVGSPPLWNGYLPSSAQTGTTIELPAGRYAFSYSSYLSAVSASGSLSSSASLTIIPAPTPASLLGLTLAVCTRRRR